MMNLHRIIICILKRLFMINGLITGIIDGNHIRLRGDRGKGLQNKFRNIKINC